jgi:hypothetical protein
MDIILGAFLIMIGIIILIGIIEASPTLGILTIILIISLTIIIPVIGSFIIYIPNDQLGSLNNYQLNPGIYIKSPWDECNIFKPNQILNYGGVDEANDLNNGKLIDHGFQSKSNDNHIINVNAPNFDFTITPQIYIQSFNANRINLNNEITQDLKTYTDSMLKHYTALDVALYQNNKLTLDTDEHLNTWFWNSHKYLQPTNTNSNNNVPVMIALACYDDDITNQVDNIKHPGLKEYFNNGINQNNNNYKSTTKSSTTNTDIIEARKISDEIKNDPSQMVEGKQWTQSEMDAYTYNLAKDNPPLPSTALPIYYDSNNEPYTIIPGTIPTSNPHYFLNPYRKEEFFDKIYGYQSCDGNGSCTGWLPINKNN